MTASPVLKIHERDNVAVALVPIKKGNPLSFNNVHIEVAEDIGVGHKIAIEDVAAGQNIIKYGAPIGMPLNLLRLVVWYMCTI